MAVLHGLAIYCIAILLSAWVYGPPANALPLHKVDCRTHLAPLSGPAAFLWFSQLTPCSELLDYSTGPGMLKIIQEKD